MKRLPLFPILLILGSLILLGVMLAKAQQPLKQFSTMPLKVPQAQAVQFAELDRQINEAIRHYNDTRAIFKANSCLALKLDLDQCNSLMVILDDKSGNYYLVKPEPTPTPKG